MIRSDSTRIDPKRRNTIDHKKKQFANATYKQQEYHHRLNFYDFPPTAEITLEQFEQWAIDRLRILAELEACSFRNKTSAETTAHITPLLQKWLPLSANTSSSVQGPQLQWQDPRLRLERQKDHYSHFILRLAFSSTEDLRRRFARIESALFRLRFQLDDAKERQAFVDSLNFDWDKVSEEEKRELGPDLLAATPGLRRQEMEEGGWFKVDFERVPELVEGRRVLLKRGKAYVPVREQMSMVVAEFGARLDKGLELTARALPRLDEDDRLTPILTHLSKNFATPDSSLSDSDSTVTGAPITASSIDHLSTSFPLCMRNLHMTLRKNSHLKHFGRLQYTLFLKGIGLSLEDCLIFWRQSFKLITDDVFNKEYRYNVRHAYGDVGGDATRRGRGYSPFSCQKILTEHPPGNGESHGCPYRHFSIDNLTGLLQATGVNDRDVLRGVKEDVEKKRFHIACNRVFDWAHRGEIKRAKEDGTSGVELNETIVHPNTYFKRSYLLKNGPNGGSQGDAMEM
ncbi:MAG: DNA primase large subunit [Lasallia pustulata]|uniref:DNA primase large subunit n=1 Tax=Lasallia pustulata TaxID=136370 RepID=A0A5M8Q1A9_9LECA|nr:MAG: DNA primase large subunit [Lasallia pustulata]